MAEEPSREGQLERPRVALDLAGLTEAQRREGSMFMGGAAAEFVTLEDDFEFSQVETVIFNWGDSKVEDIFAQIFEHQPDPNPFMFPFVPVAIVENGAWLLALQDREWDPATAYRSSDQYHLIPFDSTEGPLALTRFEALIPTRIQAIGHIGTRYALFEMKIGLGEKPPKPE